MDEVYVHTPLGFDIGNPMKCLSAVLRRFEIKKIFVYVPDKETSRNKEALEEMESLVERAFHSEMEVIKLPYELEDESQFIESVFEVYKKMEEGNKIIVCLGGGMRQIVIVLYSAAIMVSDMKDVEVFIHPEDKGKGVFITSKALKIVATMAKDKEIVREILKLLASKKEGLRLQDIHKGLRNKVNASRTTIHNYLRNLKQQEIIREKEGGYYTIY